VAELSVILELLEMPVALLSTPCPAETLSQRAQFVAVAGLGSGRIVGHSINASIDIYQVLIPVD